MALPPFSSSTPQASFSRSGKVKQTVYNVRDYGAKGDLTIVEDGAMSSGSAVLTSTTANFTILDIGKRVSVEGALGGGRLITTIQSYTSSTSVTLATNATSTVTSKEVRWCTDDTASILSAMNAAAPTGGTVLFTPGTYSISDSLLYDSRTSVGVFATGTLTSNNTNVSNNDTVSLAGLTYTFKTSFTEQYATGTLTSNNTNVSNNDTVTLGYKTYTFVTSLTEVKATGTLTSNNTNVSTSDTVILAGITYTFVTSLSGAAYEILIGASADDSLTNLASAINASAGGGSTYGIGTVANPSATSTATPTSHVLTFTAISAGTFGNSTSLSRSATTLSVSGSTLSGGVDPIPYQVFIGATADDSLTNLASAINRTTGEGTTYASRTHENFAASSTANPTSHVLTFTSKMVGTAGNSYLFLTTAVTLTPNGATLSGGVAAVSRQVLIGASADDSLTNLASAINASAGEGSTYSTGTNQNSSALSTGTLTNHVLTFSSIIIGTAGNAYGLAKSAATLSVNGTALTGGINDVGVTSLAPSLVGALGRGGVSASQGSSGVVKIQAWWDFPAGEFLVDYVAASLTDTNNEGFAVSGFVFDCNHIAVGYRSFNSNCSDWRDIVVTNCDTSPSPANHVGNPQGIVNSIAYPSNASYLNNHTNVYVAGPVDQDGFYVSEGTGSFVRLNNCTTSIAGRYGFNTDDATILNSCVSHGSLGADFCTSGSKLFNCNMANTDSGGNAICIPDFSSGFTQVVGGEFIGNATDGLNERTAAVVNIGIGASNPQFVGVNFRSGTNTSEWMWADSSAGTVLGFGNCSFNIRTGFNNDLGANPFNDNTSSASTKHTVVNNSQGINPNAYFKKTATTTYTIDRSNGIYQRVFCSNNVVLSLNNGQPGDMMILGIDPNSHTVTLPSNITLEYGTLTLSSFTWLTIIWDPQNTVWYEISRSPFAGFANPMTTLGDILYENNTPTAARLAGNITSAKQFLTQTGTGSVSAAPAWGAIAESDVTNLTSDLALKAPSASPALTGSPTAPTQTAGDNSTKIATDAFVTIAVNNAIAGVNPAVAVQAATAAVLPNSPTYSNGVAGVGATLTTATTNTALVVDGYTPALNERILVKNQASSFQNGVYFVSQLAALGLAWILTRALDYDQPSDMNNTGAIPVANGTVNVDTSWVQTSQVTTVGTDAVTFTQFSLNPTTLVTLTDVQTLTNKNITTRINSTASSATPSINTDTTDQFNITALAAAITSMTTNLTGTPLDGQKLRIRIKDNGTARAITWGASFASSGVATLPTTTVISKTHMMGFIYDSVAAAWICMAADAVGY